MSTMHGSFSVPAPVFDADETHAISVAFDEICKRLNVSPDAEGIRETIAARVIELSRAGERDPDVICQVVCAAATSRTALFI